MLFDSERVRFAFDSRPLNALTHGLQMLEKLSSQSYTSAVNKASAVCLQEKKIQSTLTAGHTVTNAINNNNNDNGNNDNDNDTSNTNTNALVIVTFSKRLLIRLDVNVVCHDWATKYEVQYVQTDGLTH